MPPLSQRSAEWVLSLIYIETVPWTHSDFLKVIQIVRGRCSSLKGPGRRRREIRAPRPASSRRFL